MKQFCTSHIPRLATRRGCGIKKDSVQPTSAPPTRASLTSKVRHERPPRPLSRPPLLTRGILCLATLFILSLSTGAVAADGPCVIPGRGHFYIHVGAGGLFGAFAHDHLIEAQRIEGCAVIDSNDLTHSSIKLTFSTADIRVLDPKENAKDRPKVQTTMEMEVLRVSQYPQVTFESTGLDRSGTADVLRVSGNLTFRGQTQPVVVPLTLVHLDDGTYRARGEYKLKQTAFGIQPIQLAGGTVKVKDEVRTEFELFLK